MKPMAAAVLDAAVGRGRFWLPGQPLPLPVEVVTDPLLGKPLGGPQAGVDVVNVSLEPPRVLALRSAISAYCCLVWNRKDFRTCSKHCL